MTSEPVALAERIALVLLDRHLPDEVVDLELGEPLPDPARRRAPLRLPELEHHASRLTSTLRLRSCCWSEPQTSSHRVSTPSSTMR